MSMTRLARPPTAKALSVQSRSFLGPNATLATALRNGAPPTIGIVEGAGIGPEVIAAALQVLEAVRQVLGLSLQLRRGAPVGEEAEARCGDPLPEEAIRFFSEVLDAGGAVLSGPSGGRYVYDLRKRFDLFCKFVPVRPWPQLSRAGVVSTNELSRVDLLIVRDNVGGVYQGEWQMHTTSAGRVASHSFTYTDAQVQRLAEVAARAAAGRRGALHVVVKDAGVPSIAALWRDVAETAANRQGVEAKFVNVDFAAYELIRHPAAFDVVLTPNLFGDILVDLTGALLGSRGVTFSGNFDGAGRAVYQTNHGCARDLAGADVANPAGQILSLAMLLRESFGLDQAATLMERALAETWAQGWRTADLAESGSSVIGTRAMASRVADEVFRLGEKRLVA
jgi:3-isopropylmalate dehydrogenase